LHLRKLCGNFGPFIIAITTALFAFSTVIAGYYYGESCLKYIKKKTSKFDVFVLKLVSIIFVVVGSVISSNSLWQSIDLLVALLAIVNIYSIFMLRSIVIN